VFDKILETNVEYPRDPIDHLDAVIKKMTSVSLDQRKVAKDMIAGFVVCRYYLGTEWTREKLALSLAAKEEKERLLIQNEMMRLGHYLYGLRGMHNFSHMVTGLRRKTSEAALWEIYCAHLFLDAGNTVEFVQERGVRGYDFDMRVTTKDNKRTFNV
jgi:hypothetical protein